MWAFLCPPCGGYEPLTQPDYSGGLSGACQGCGAGSRELHRFRAFIHSAEPCGCWMSHRKVTGDVDARTGVAAEVTS